MSFQPTGQPSFDDVFATSFRDALGLARKNLLPAVVLIALGTAAALAIALSGQRNVTAIQYYIDAVDAVLVVMAYFAMAAAVRTIHPDYRMTVMSFLGIVGFNLLASLLMFAAALLFIVPGWWVGVKLMLTPYTYALTGSSAALRTTWNMTTGFWWQTLGLTLLVAIAIIVMTGIVFAAAAFIVYAAPVAVVIAAPVVLAVVTWTLHFQALANTRWTASLLARRGPDAYALAGSSIQER